MGAGGVSRLGDTDGEHRSGRRFHRLYDRLPLLDGVAGIHNPADYPGGGCYIVGKLSNVDEQDYRLSRFIGGGARLDGYVRRSVRLNANVFVPEMRFVSDELLHESNTFRILQHADIDSIGA